MNMDDKWTLILWWCFLVFFSMLHQYISYIHSSSTVKCRGQDLQYGSCGAEVPWCRSSRTKLHWGARLVDGDGFCPRNGVICHPSMARRCGVFWALHYGRISFPLFRTSNRFLNAKAALCKSFSAWKLLCVNRWFANISNPARFHGHCLSDCHSRASPGRYHLLCTQSPVVDPHFSFLPSKLQFR